MSANQPLTVREGRDHLRYQFTTEPLCFVGLTSTAECQPAHLRDISPGGVGLLVNCPVDPGTAVPVELLSRRRTKKHVKLLRVIHCQPVDARCWSIGGTFLRELSSDEWVSIRG